MLAEPDGALRCRGRGDGCCGASRASPDSGAASTSTSSHGRIGEIVLLSSLRGEGKGRRDGVSIEPSFIAETHAEAHAHADGGDVSEREPGSHVDVGEMHSGVRIGVRISVRIGVRAWPVVWPTSARRRGVGSSPWLPVLVLVAVAAADRPGGRDAGRTLHTDCGVLAFDAASDRMRSRMSATSR